MNPARAQLMGMREGLKQKDIAAILAGRSHSDAIKEKLVGSFIMLPLEKIDTGAILFHASELHEAAEKHRKLMDEIAKINEELE